MNQFMDSLAEICKSHPLTSKVIIVPNYHVGQEILKSIVLETGSWINLKVATLENLARENISSKLSRNEFQVIDDKVAVAILQKIILKLQTENKFEYFKNDNSLNQLLPLLLSSINELRRIDITAEVLCPDCFVSTTKGRDIKQIMVRYQEELRKRKLIDTADVIAIATSEIPDCEQNDIMFLILDYMDFSPQERKLLHKISLGNLLLLDSETIFGIEPLSEPYWDLKRVSAKTSQSIFSWLYAPTDSFQDVKGDISLFSAYGITNEVKEVLRRIIYQQCPLDEVQIICTSERDYTHAFLLECMKLNLPITFSGGIPISLTSAGRIVAGLIEWIKKDFHITRLREILESGDVELEIGAYKAARLLRGASIGWGRNRYETCLEKCIAEYKEKVRHVKVEESDQIIRYKKKIADIEGVKKEMKWIFSQLPLPDDNNNVEMAKLAAGINAVLKRWKKTAEPKVGMAFSKVAELLCEYEACEGLVLPLEVALSVLYEGVNSCVIDNNNSQPGHIYMTSYRQAGWTNRRNTFVVGLSADFFPGDGGQDPILLDVERSKISKELELYRDRPMKKKCQMTRVLASLRGDITVSYSAFDPVKCRQLFPSSIMLQTFRLIEKDNAKDYSDLENFLRQPIGFVKKEDQVLDRHEWWISKLYPVLKSNGLEDAVIGCYQGLRRGKKAVEQRRGSKLTAFDGKIEGGLDAYDPRINSELVMSCSRIEMIAKCPFKYFLCYILGIKSPGDIDYDANQWLDPLARGVLLHDIYYRFMSVMADKNVQVSYPGSLSLLSEVASAAIDEYKIKIPPPSDNVYLWERGKIEQACEIFLKAEADNQDAIPTYFELPFGMDDATGNDVDKPAKIELSDGRGFYLRGVVDRIDKVDAGKYRVWDYKTGSSYGYKKAGFIENGRQLQHALYSMAMRQILKKRLNEDAEIELAGYLFHSEKGEGTRIIRLQNRETDVVKAINHLFDIISTGAFHATDKKNECEFCEYKVICVDMPEQMATKLDDEKNSCLNSWKELKSFD